MDELKEAGTQALLGIIESVTATANFLKGEIPLAVKELLTYYTALYALWFVVCAAGVCGGVWVFKKCYPKCDPYGGSPAPELGCAGGAIAIIVGAVVGIATLADFLKITLAPRIWLIEYAANLVR